SVAPPIRVSSDKTGMREAARAWSCPGRRGRTPCGAAPSAQATTGRRSPCAGRAAGRALQARTARPRAHKRALARSMLPNTGFAACTYDTFDDRGTFDDRDCEDGSANLQPMIATRV